MSMGMTIYEALEILSHNVAWILASPESEETLSTLSTDAPIKHLFGHVYTITGDIYPLDFGSTEIAKNQIISTEFRTKSAEASIIMLGEFVKEMRAR